MLVCLVGPETALHRIASHSIALKTDFLGCLGDQQGCCNRDIRLERDDLLRIVTVTACVCVL